MVNIAINGLGEIGRRTLRRYRNDYNSLGPTVVAINDKEPPEAIAHLIEYDSTYGLYPEIYCMGDKLILNSDELHPIRMLQEKDPCKLPWKELDVDVVIEATGAFADGDKAKVHLDAGAKKVIITAPAPHVDLTVVFGVNHDLYDPTRHNVISNASCTTNCLAPVAKVLHESFGIEAGIFTTTHAYTGDQRILDTPHKDLRRARAAGVNIVPTSTGAADTIGLIIPDLKDKLKGMALRVPTQTVSLIDLVANLKKPVTAAMINATLKTSAAERFNNTLSYTDKTLVSSDFRGDPHSAIVDSLLTNVQGDNMAQVIAWYDNEWAYACRLVDLMRYVAERL